jgi:predicted secreted hydrolase
MAISPYIELPKDQYAHAGAAAEWWWHIGTLKSGNRVFGFEVNAAGFQNAAGKYLLSFIMITDVAAGTHYQQITLFDGASDWAETDSEKPWKVRLGEAGAAGAIAMDASPANPLHMRIQASFCDAGTKTGIGIKLDLKQAHSRPPLLVWGDGRSPQPVNPHGHDPLQNYNYYYSLTDLAATGTVQIGGESFAVTGLTWMDHEYGAWPQSVMWALQDVQLDNGIRLSNFTKPNTPLKGGVSVESNVTVLWPDGSCTFENSVTTPHGPGWKGPSGTLYYSKIDVDIPALNAHFTVTSLLPGQEFWNPQLPHTQVYEGVAVAQGIFEGRAFSGTAWNEQHLAGGSGGAHQRHSGARV